MEVANTITLVDNTTDAKRGSHDPRFFYIAIVRTATSDLFSEARAIMMKCAYELALSSGSPRVAIISV